MLSPFDRCRIGVVAPDFPTEAALCLLWSHSLKCAEAAQPLRLRPEAGVFTCLIIGHKVNFSAWADSCGCHIGHDPATQVLMLKCQCLLPPLFMIPVGHRKRDWCLEDLFVLPYTITYVADHDTAASGSISWKAALCKRMLAALSQLNDAFGCE